MGTAQELKVEVRDEIGSRKVKRVRAAGKIPAVIYGHGEGNQNLSVPADEFDRIIHQGARIVSLTGGVTSDAFIRDVQWDVFGTNVIHIDFTRVAAGELLDTVVAITVRGVAPGTKLGGDLEQPIHEMPIQLPPRSMTDHIEISVNELGLNEKITVGQLDLPDGAKVLLDKDAVIVQCMEKQQSAPDEAPEAPATEEASDDS